MADRCDVTNNRAQPVGANRVKLCWLHRADGYSSMRYHGSYLEIAEAERVRLRKRRGDG